MEEKNMEKKELKAKDIFYEKEEEVKPIPSDYVPVKLSSVGRLGMPPILHVRDYTFEEATMLGDLEEGNEIEILIQVLQSIIYEDIEVGDLHKQDLLEILMTVQGTWYTPKIDGLPYLLDETLDKEIRYEKENISKATILFSDINTAPLNEDCSIPINLKRGDTQISLILPRIKNEFVAKKLVDQKYALEENKLSDIAKKVNKGTATLEEQEAYTEFSKNKSKDFLRYLQAQLIYSFNGKVLETMDEKLVAMKGISLSVWKIFNELIDKKFTFGINPEVTFECTVNHKPVTRRFNFRAVHFLSSLESQDDSGFDISYG
jgi:hypothetical protein